MDDIIQVCNVHLYIGIEHSKVFRQLSNLAAYAGSFVDTQFVVCSMSGFFLTIGGFFILLVIIRSGALFMHVVGVYTKKCRGLDSYMKI